MDMRDQMDQWDQMDQRGHRDQSDQAAEGSPVCDRPTLSLINQARWRGGGEGGGGFTCY